MSKNSSRKALLTSNKHLTDTDGKSLRLLRLAELLDRAGFKVIFIVSKCSLNATKKFVVIETKARLRAKLSDSLRKKLFHFTRQFIELLSFYIKLLITGVTCDLVVSSLMGPDTDSLFACIFSKIKRTPFVYDYDDPSPEIQMLSHKSTCDFRVKLSRFSKNVLMRHASLVLTAADTIRSQIMKDSGNTKSVFTFYNSPRIDGVNIDEDRKRLRQKRGLNTKSFIVSYLGNVPRWGIEAFGNTLMDCAKDFRPDENVLFLIIGGGPWEKGYRKLIRRRCLTNRIVITGKKTRQNALEYFMASNVFFFPFGFNCVSIHIVPTKLFDAMALGIPVLSTRLPNFVQILGDDGIYFDGSHIDLTRKIRWCMKNQGKLDKIGSKLTLKFLGEYSLEKRSLSLETVLRTLPRQISQ